jgi:hypothetical protein
LVTILSRTGLTVFVVKSNPKTVPRAIANTATKKKGINSAFCAAFFVVPIARIIEYVFLPRPIKSQTASNTAIAEEKEKSTTVIIDIV